MIAVNHHQDPKTGAEAEQNESILGRRVIGIIEQEGVLIGKHRLRLGEADAVLTAVRGGLRGVPSEAELAHGEMYIRCMYVATGRLRCLTNPASAAGDSPAVPNSTFPQSLTGDQHRAELRAEATVSCKRWLGSGQLLKPLLAPEGGRVGPTLVGDSERIAVQTDCSTRRSSEMVCRIADMAS